MGGRPPPPRLIVAGLLLALSASVASAHAEQVPVRLNGASVLEVAGEPATAHVRRIERRPQRIVGRTDFVGPPDVVPDFPPESRVIQLQSLPIVNVREAVTTVDALAAGWAAVLALFWLLAATVRALLRLLFMRVISDLTVENLLKQLAYYAVWAIGILVAADVLGFEPGTVITGLGLTGLALGFALKDVISNFVSGTIILALRPFEIGDHIVVGPTEGTVQRIELRATAIKTYDGSLLLVPNAELFTSRVTNNAAAPVRRAAVEVPVGYGTDLEAAEGALLNAAQNVAIVLDAPAPSVRLRQLGPTDVLMELRFLDGLAACRPPGHAVERQTLGRRGLS